MFLFEQTIEVYFQADNRILRFFFIVHHDRQLMYK